jgi:hypothetical protein
MVTDETISDSCDVKDTTSSIPLTREALYKLVWSEPMLKVAARYNVSSSYMARVCTLLNVPRPERGYWSKLSVGKAPPVPPLRDARPGDELVWSRDGEHVKVPQPLPRPPSNITKKRPNRVAIRIQEHSLIRGVKTLFEAGRLSYDVGYLKPAKKLLVDLVVTKTGLDKALTFANNLFSLFEEYDYPVVIAPQGGQLWRAEVDVHEKPRRNPGYNDLWSPWRCTVVYIGTVAIGLTIFEMSEEVDVRYVNGKYVREKDYVPPRRGPVDHTWTTRRNLPTGRLCLQAYSPYPRAKWVRRWQETRDRNLIGQIKSIVTELEEATVDIARLVEEGECQAKLEREKWEAEREQWRREEAARIAAKVLKESKEELLQIIHNWGEVNRIEQFFLDAERQASILSEDERIKILERLKLARNLIGSVDALRHFKAWKSPDER